MIDQLCYIVSKEEIFETHIREEQVICTIRIEITFLFLEKLNSFF
jgi:hypothetical protein